MHSNLYLRIQDQQGMFFIYYIKIKAFILISILQNFKNEQIFFYSNLDFEKAYCLYRLNQVNEALKVVEVLPNPSLKLKELKAQILYRLEKYEECFSVYRDIIKNSHDEYEDERQANLAAVVVNLTIEGSVSF